MPDTSTSTDVTFAKISALLTQLVEEEDSEDKIKNCLYLLKGIIEFKLDNIPWLKEKLEIRKHEENLNVETQL